MSWSWKKKNLKGLYKKVNWHVFGFFRTTQVFLDFRVDGYFNKCSMPSHALLVGSWFLMDDKPEKAEQTGSVCVCLCWWLEKDHT